MRSAIDHQSLSIRELAEATGIGYGTLQGVLTGAREPKLSHVYLIADALGVEPATLLGADAA
jgi:transcriptional regulator with XRE-family HTH domain